MAPVMNSKSNGAADSVIPSAVDDAVSNAAANAAGSSAGSATGSATANPAGNAADNKSSNAEGDRLDDELARCIEDIRSGELAIVDIILTEITRSFLEYMTHHAELSMARMITIYSYVTQLLLIKARFLLGGAEEGADEVALLKESAIDILIEFQRLKKLADELKRLQNRDMRVIARKDRRAYISAHCAPAQFSLAPLAHYSPATLALYLRALLQKKRIITSLPKFNQFALPLMNERLLRFKREKDIDFDTLIEEGDRRAQTISALLVVLAAAADRIVITKQRAPFEAIRIHFAAQNAPSMRQYNGDHGH